MAKLQWVKDCWDYHSRYISELDVAVDWGDWEEEQKRCWCCGHKSKLQKCHIIPKSLGGTDEPDNLVPLCAHCHDLAPDVNDKGEMFKWIREQQNPLSGLGLGRYWHLCDVISDCAKDMKGKIDWDVLTACIEKSLDMTSFHFSQSNAGIKIKASTREWYVRRAFDFYRKEMS